MGLLQYDFISAIEKDFKSSDKSFYEYINKLSFRNLTSLFIFLIQEKVKNISHLSILEEFITNKFISPTTIDQRKLIEIEYLICKAIPNNFIGVEFPPINPLGLNSVITNTNQKMILPTLRKMEVVSDLSTLLALEYAKKTKMENGSYDIIDLYSIQRIFRMKLYKTPGFTPHFKMLAMSSGGSASQFPDFESIVLKKHLEFYLKLFTTLETNNYAFKNITITISDLRIAESIIKSKNIKREEIQKKTKDPKFHLFSECGFNLPSSIDDPCKVIGNIPPEFNTPIKSLIEINEKAIIPLKSINPKINFDFNLDRVGGIGHYSNFCFNVRANDIDENRIILVDGGITDWTQKLLNNKKERFFVSGIGIELLLKRFYKP